MAFNYYEGWTEAELLAERRAVQQSLSVGRTTESRLAGEQTRNDSRDTPSHELTLKRLAYALFKLYEAGETEDRVYADPHAVINIQSHY